MASASPLKEAPEGSKAVRAFLLGVLQEEASGETLGRLS
jgi:hypothetical protein